ncbi:hypothetical protein E4T47_03398 [Aureobasidium subglaciale]|nr:hypothetical protein E4T43_04989 [Aureobasidium subglaciale]KAI5273268.1 hypothetical protein E4T47_03398 [Aureobasidium subglaciale]
MKKSFAARRVPRKIGHDDADVPSDASSNNDSTASSTVKRPLAKHRKSSSLRPSFADDDDDTDSTVVTPKRTNLSRLAIQRNAEKRSDIAFRPGLDAALDRPTYNRDYLDELKQSTPATPKDVASASTTDNEDTASRSNIAVDVKSKFGSDLSRYQPPTAIPTAAEIQEKKARRARLAKENDFISLEDDGDNGEDDDDAVTRDDQGRLILKPKEKYPETRLEHDDEDMLEGFDDFTTDGNITFGRKAQKEEDQKRRAEMASMIANVEGQGADDDEEDDESEAERNAAFEVAQTRHGTYAAREQEAESTRPQTPPKVVPLPTMDSVVERLRKRLEEMESVRANKANEMQSLVQEKTMIGEEEVRVQAALKETGEKYQKLREGMGLETQLDDKQIVEANGVHQIPRTNRAEDSDSDDEEEAERPGLGTSGMGSGMRRDMSDWGM